MPGLGRTMCDFGVIEAAATEARKGRSGSTRNEAVEQRRDLILPCRERRSENSGKLTAAEDHGRVERIAVLRRMTHEASFDGVALPLKAYFVEPGATPSPAAPTAAEQRRA